MGINLMYSPLETIFQATMEREGKTITAYTSGKQFQAFMRHNDDRNNYEDRITLFYSVNAPVMQGNLISYGNRIYILVNRETEENNCYYKSSALACNGMITLNNGHVIGVPCYGSLMKNGLIEQNNVMSIIDGNMEFITESNSLSRQIEIGNTFNEYDRTWKVDNVYYKDGVLHIITEVSANEKPYGELWLKKNKSDSIYSTVSDVNSLPTLTYNYRISGISNLVLGFSRTYSLYITDNYGNELKDINFQWNVVSDFDVKQTINGNRIELCVENEELVDQTLLLQVLVNNIVMAEMKISTVEGW